MVASEKSSKPPSLHTELNILQDENKTKSISTLKDRSFTKLGTTSSKVLDSQDNYTRLLVETNINNLDIQAGKLYLNSHFSH